MEFIGTSHLTSTIKGNIRWTAAELFEVPEDDEEHGAVVSLTTECDIYSFGSIALQVLTCKVPYYNVKKDNVILGQVIRGKKPEPPMEPGIAPSHWEFIQRCWLPRADHPLAAELVAFASSMDTDATRLLDDRHGLREGFPRPPVIEVAAAQDRQISLSRTLNIARRPEQPGDKRKQKQQQQGQSQAQAQASTSQTPPVAVSTSTAPLPAVNSTTMAGAAGLQPASTI
ncbi:hypothetical protein AZE42_12248 [Rhizopogon vesiculosus]|uniref:Serine-threonine/tyrosine-protein kinase catalytic domain-containing protein n=1 Tax=Rhizopogon vesiculosus TaxID=180088 RepID=A0A1J8QPL2_9AGAM|nr:hypothetical protein AZE42_12248 [Rhizopogon vesiculosus]